MLKFLLTSAAAFVLTPNHHYRLSPPRATTDVVIIGGGYGGLSAAALLATYGKRVVLLESHDTVGGCAHAFQRSGYKIDVGPSLWSGLGTPSSNPMRQVLDATGTKVEWRSYDGWGVHEVATGTKFRMSPSTFQKNNSDWTAFLESVKPVFEASAACPPLCLTLDPLGFVLEAFLPYLLPATLRASLAKGQFVPDLLTGPASLLLPSPQKNFVTRWVDYLAFAISGLPANGTVGAAVAYSVGDLYLRPESYCDYPVGGSGAVADALKETIERRGGIVELNSHVTSINIDDKKRAATGITLKNGTTIEAKDAVISNADIWTTAKLTGDTAWVNEIQATVEPTPSFLHLWVGFDASDIPETLDGHHTVLVNGSFASDDVPIDQRGNMMIICISSLFDSSVAPKNRHLAHVYAAANEPRSYWDNLNRRDYEHEKEVAIAPLWTALEAVIPDVRRRADLVIAGTPRSHEFWNRRYRGTYGPTTFAKGTTPFEGLFTVGDSNFPGIGIPAVAASACLVANAIAGRRNHSRLLTEMRDAGTLRAGSDWWDLARRHRPPAIPGGRISLVEDSVE